MKAKLLNLIEWALAIILLLAAAGVIYAVSTAHAQPRPVQLWTLWATDTDGVPTRALLRFTSLDGCIGASYRHGLTTGETATCLPYRIGDMQ
jgi:hypothetical protein